jgi:hypothetical protein
MTFFHSPNFPIPESCKGIFAQKGLDLYQVFTLYSVCVPQKDETPQLLQARGFQGKAGWIRQPVGQYDTKGYTNCQQLSECDKNCHSPSLPDAAGCCETGVNWCQCLLRAPLELCQMLARPLRPGPENRCSDHKPVSQAGGLSRANGLIRDADSSVRPAEQATATPKAW